MSQQAKAFARVFSYAVPTELPDGKMKFVIEWKLLRGARQAGKEAFIVDDIASDDKLKSDLRDALAAFLSQKFAPEVFKPRDIIGYSV